MYPLRNLRYARRVMQVFGPSSFERRRDVIATSVHRWLCRLVAFSIVIGSGQIALADKNREKKAAKHYEQGKAYFRVGEFALCASEFQASHALEAKPGALFNQARCSEELGDLGTAIKLFEQYLVADPEGAHVSEATARRAALTRKRKESPKSADSSAIAEGPQRPISNEPSSGSQEPQIDLASPQDPGTPYSNKRTMSLVAGAVGVVSLGVAVGFGFRAKSDWDRAQELCPDGSPCTSIEGVTHADDATIAASISTAFGGLSALSLAAATYFWMTQPERSNHTIGLGPTSDRSGARVYFGTEF